MMFDLLNHFSFVLLGKPTQSFGNENERNEITQIASNSALELVNMKWKSEQKLSQINKLQSNVIEKLYAVFVSQFLFGFVCG
jgi:hypothetical protein